MADAATDPLGLALVAEAARRSALAWVRVGDAPERLVWHATHDGAVCLVLGGGEQPLDLPTGGATVPVVVTLRSKDKGARLVSYRARVDDVRPGDEAWAPIVAALAAARLNAPDGEHAPQRWEREARIVRLAPLEIVEQPGTLPTGSLAAPPVPTPATTLHRLPFVLGRRRTDRRAGERGR